ncbi:hypothetical protein DL96DRAFT_1572610 [Flagelloscypha sp. PMI_526]|nr:hypothetical protein DL96DRAFT_1572610 [Flagelloscypha sp. PMI_526]
MATKPHMTSEANEPSKALTPAPTRPFLNKALTYIAHGTTPFIATYLLVHLSAPILANFGGSSLASKAMILERTYYSASYGKIMLVVVPVTTHVLSSILKRFTYAKPKEQPRSLDTPMTGGGLGVAFLWFPIHFFIHSVGPRLTSPPIHENLDFEFVKTGLKTWPIRTSILYLGLVAALTVHIGEAMGLLGYLKGCVGRQTKESIRFRIKVIALTISLPVFTGLFYAAAWEPTFAPQAVVGTFRAAFQKFPLFWL